MHEASSPDRAKLVVRARSNWDASAEMERKLAGVDVPVEEPGK